MKLKAIYRNGAFVLQVPCHLSEETEVDLMIQASYILPPEVTDPQEREQILKTLLQRMQNNPLPANSPRLKRDELHERC